MNYHSHECLMTFWPSPILRTWYRAWPSPNYKWFPWSICNGCCMPDENAYLSGHLIPSPHFGTCLFSKCGDKSSRTCHVFTWLFTSNTPWCFLDFAAHRKRISVLDYHYYRWIFNTFKMPLVYFIKKFEITRPAFALLKLYCGHVNNCHHF